MRKLKLQFTMTINDFENVSLVNDWTEKEQQESFSKILLPFFSTTDTTLTSQYINNLVSSFRLFYQNWIDLMSNEELAFTNEQAVLLFIKNSFYRWILNNAISLKNNYESILLEVNDEYSTNRTYSTNKTTTGSTTYKEGYSGGGLSNQTGTKQSNSSTDQTTQTGTDTDKYTQTDTLRKLNYIQLLKPFDFDTFFKDLENAIFAIIWSE